MLDRVEENTHMVMSRLIPLCRASKAAHLFAIQVCYEHDIPLNTLPIWEYDYARDQVVTPTNAAWTVPDTCETALRCKLWASGKDDREIALGLYFATAGMDRGCREIAQRSWEKHLHKERLLTLATNTDEVKR